MHDVSPNGCLTGPAALAVVWIAHVLVPLIAGLVALGRSRQSARICRVADVRASTDAVRPLAPGRAALHGPVEYAPGEQLAVTIAIEQAGTEHKTKHGYSHRWTETRRRVNAAPFYVRDGRGTSVRVEPDERTILVDRLDRTARHDRANRERFAEISNGEVVYVLGELRPGHDPTTGGYRGTETSLVMKPPANGRLLVSSEPLGDRFRREARIHGLYALVFFGMLLLFGLFDLGFHARMFAGHVERATVVERVVVRGKSSHCALTVRSPSGERFGFSAGSGACSRLYEGDQVALTVVGERTFAALGAAPAINGTILVLAGVALTIALVVYRRRRREWYDGKVVDTGRGKLSEST
jgi:hypothetical protein